MPRYGSASPFIASTRGTSPYGRSPRPFGRAPVPSPCQRRPPAVIGLVDWRNNGASPMKIRMSIISAMLAALAGCGGGSTTLSSPVNGGQPTVTLNTPSPGAAQLSGHAYNVNPSTTKVVIYVLTNQWYVQPLVAAPFTNIASDGSWQSSTYPWQAIVVLLVNPSTYTPAATKITNPALDPGVLAYTSYPSAPVSVNFSGRTWGIKMTGNVASDQFQPGPNYWSADSSVVRVAADGLHLKITKINGNWQCGEVYLLQSLGYGTYTVQINSRLDQLDTNTVAAPLFIYADTSHELDNEYSGPGGLIPSPNNAQFVAQPYTVPGNLVRYRQPAASQLTSQMEWQPDHVTFRTWNGWSDNPTASDIIYQWTYTGSYIPQPGQESVHINLWLLNGQAPITGAGDEMVIQSFTFQGSSQLSSPVLDTFPNDDLQVSYTDLAGLRSLSADARGRQNFDPLLQTLGESMHPLGIEAAKDVDEVMLGWHDETMDPAKALGLVAGRFKPDEFRQYSGRAGLAIIPYKGADIYQLGSTGALGSLYFTLFGDSLLAFGQFNDVTAMIDSRAGRSPSLKASAEFAKWR